MRSLFRALARFLGGRQPDARDPRHVASTPRAIDLFKAEAERLLTLPEADIQRELDENFARQAELIQQDMRMSCQGTMVYGRAWEIITPTEIFHLNPKTGAFEPQFGTVEAAPNEAAVGA